MEENSESHVEGEVESLSHCSTNSDELVVVAAIVENSSGDSQSDYTSQDVSEDNLDKTAPCPTLNSFIATTEHKFDPNVPSETLEPEMISSLNKSLEEAQDNYNVPSATNAFETKPQNQLNDLDNNIQKCKSPIEKLQTQGNSPVKEIHSNIKCSPVKEVNKNNLVAKDPESPHLEEALIITSDKRYEVNVSITETLESQDKTSANGMVDIQYKEKSPLQDNKIVQEGCKSPLLETATKLTSNSSDLIDKDSNSSKSEICLMKNNEPDYEMKSDSENQSEVEEKEHNKSISRELKSLIASAKESKIISEYTQVKTKMRKSRNLDASNSSFNISLELEKTSRSRRASFNSRSRRASVNSQFSNSSETSERPPKRSMRSQNPDFVSKQKHFLNLVTGKSKDNGDMDIDSGEEMKQSPVESPLKTTKRKSAVLTPTTGAVVTSDSDPYCWRCHWLVEADSNEKPPAQCTVCPRSYHFRCLNSNERNKLSAQTKWACPECMLTLQSESSDTRSQSLRKIPLGKLCELLQYAWSRICETNGIEPFMTPVDRTVYPNYDSYVVHPMDLTMIKENIKSGNYGSTEAFLSDVLWILHNSIIFNAVHTRLTAAARALVRSSRTEMADIEACAECYGGAHTRPRLWFRDACREPHVLLWAKLKGFPYWPAKGMSVNSSGHVDVRFFGAHDRAWVPAKDCYLYSVEDPNGFKTKRPDIIDSMKELDEHIKNIVRKFGKFVHAPFKTPLDITRLDEQLRAMIPYDEGTTDNGKEPNSPSTATDKITKSRPNSDGESFSDIQNSLTSTPKTKKSDAVATKINYPEEGPQSETVYVAERNDENKKCSARKRRRSQLEEAVFTVIDTPDNPKRAHLDKSDAGNEIDPLSDSTSIQASDIDSTDKSKDKDTTISKKREKGKDPNKESPTVTVIKTFEGSDSLPKIKMTFIKKDPTKQNDIDKDELKAESFKASNKTITKESSVSDKSNTILKQRKSNDNKANISKENVGKKEKKSKPNRQELNNSIQDTGKIENKDSHSGKNNKSTNNNNKIVSQEKRLPSKESNIILLEDSSDSNCETNKRKSKAKVVTDDKSKNKIIFDDTTSLSVIAQKGSHVITPVPGFPTITNVRSLFSPNNSPSTSSCLLKQPSASPNSKDTSNNTQKSETEKDPVGRVGVCSFARMSKSPNQSKDIEPIQIEIKAEPMDLDDPERQTEKLDLLNSFNLRPVQHNNNPKTNNTPKTSNMPVTKAILSNPKKNAPTEQRPKARKSFPQGKKPEEARSELNGKNSMVYIPIQPPAIGPPLAKQSMNRVHVPVLSKCVAVQSVLKPVTSVPNSSQEKCMNTAIPVVSSPNPVPVTGITNLSGVTALSGVTSSVTPVPAMTTVTGVTTSTALLPPTAVHTMPLITTVNGQWTLALQPMMSVGNIDVNQQPVAPLVNGVGDRPPVVNNIITPQVNTEPDPNLLPEVSLLQQRPLINPFDPLAPVGEVPTPSSAGPLTAKLNQNASRLTDFFRVLLEDCIDKLDSRTSNATHIKLQMEHLRWRHQQEIAEMKHNHELMMSELRASVEKERARIVSETKATCQAELEAAVNLTKTKQWCANCRQEAQFYCCWNTSYCDYPCQRAHWAQHFAVCTQQRSQEGGKNDRRLNALDNRLPPEITPKTGSQLTQAGTRILNHVNSKASLIVSMVEDSNGNSTVKCLGSYKPPTVPTPSVAVNNQVPVRTEDPGKKVVTSGGYLIVGVTPDKTGVTMN